jgi:hypothetical protein
MCCTICRPNRSPSFAVMAGYTSLRVLKLALQVVEQGDPSAASDAGVSALMATTALEGGAGAQGGGDPHPPLISPLRLYGPTRPTCR